jgi:hypothetical protein
LHKRGYRRSTTINRFKYSGGLPQNCDTLWLGETFTFRALFTDNRALGSFSIEIHENFDHHAHSTEVTECELNPVKQPVNPFLFIRNFEIPEGLAEYEANVEILIPAGNSAEFSTKAITISSSALPTVKDGRPRKG